MAVFYSHQSSYFSIPKDSSAELLFPGRNEIPQGSYGYVRTKLVRHVCWKYRSGQLKQLGKCPFRDYPDSVRTNISQLFDTPYDKDRIIISARNVLNEWPYQARINKNWFKRYGDPNIPSYFPVLSIKKNKLKVLPYSNASKDSNILTGLPLVIDTNPMNRDFLIANSSDIAHSYNCHPKAFFGPALPAWQEISDKWHEEFQKWIKNPKRSDGIRTKNIDSVAQSFNKWEGAFTDGADLTHSIIVDVGDKNLYTMVLTGSLWSIAKYLAKNGTINAFILDQSGSVCYCYLPKGGSQPKPIVSTTNWRDSGTSFLSIETKGYVSQKRHIWMPSN